MSAVGWLVYVLRDLGHRHKREPIDVPVSIFSAEEWRYMIETATRNGER